MLGIDAAGTDSNDLKQKKVNEINNKSDDFDEDRDDLSFGSMSSDFSRDERYVFEDSMMVMTGELLISDNPLNELNDMDPDAMGS